MNVTIIIIFLILIIFLLGLPMVFLLIIVKKIHRRFIKLEQELKRVIEEIKKNRQ